MGKNFVFTNCWFSVVIEIEDHLKDIRQVKLNKAKKSLQLMCIYVDKEGRHGHELEV